ncbi:MAG: hypothetical protein M3Y41_17345 [Pseudomonadota bacterium]|nr:hypothetical protein [Pseudomonadota bacterium]
MSAGTVIGAGSDTLVLQMAEDPDGPPGAAGRDAAFTVNVDGQQIGGLQTTTANEAAGQAQAFTFEGNFAPGQHVVTITFANNSGTPGDKSGIRGTRSSRSRTRRRFPPALPRCRPPCPAR